jgi:dTDP-glucose 4,6-dehydratase
MVTWVADRQGHDRRYSLDDSALRAAGYAPRVPFGHGLAETVRWYAAHRAWWEPLKRAADLGAPGSGVAGPAGDDTAAAGPGRGR